MAKVTLSRVELQAGRLPGVCVKSGQRADAMVRAEVSDFPTWTLLLMLAGVLPFLIAVYFTKERIVAELPVCTSVLNRYRRRTGRAWAFVGVAVACGVAAAVSGLVWLWLGVPAAMIVVVVTLVQRRLGWFDARPVFGTTLAELRRVSPESARVASEHEAGRPEIHVGVMVETTTPVGWAMDP